MRDTQFSDPVPVLRGTLGFSLTPDPSGPSHSLPSSLLLSVPILFSEALRISRSCAPRISQVSGGRGVVEKCSGKLGRGVHGCKAPHLDHKAKLSCTTIKKPFLSDSPQIICSTAKAENLGTLMKETRSPGTGKEDEAQALAQDGFYCPCKAFQVRISRASPKHSKPPGPS